MDRRQLVLANGLRCHLHHQPEARDAAALVSVQVGSLNEPEAWPGLAHLLEHTLFGDCQRFSDAQRLMPWVQQQGGEVNATTQLSQSAFFFQVPAPQLAAGAKRLSAMLAAPQFSAACVAQECAVIDAEYQLLAQHDETLCEAALLAAAGEPYTRFRIGNRAAFGDNVTDIQLALRDFHRRFYHAGTMQLWLQGPQSLAELAEMAQPFASLPASGAAPQPLPLPQIGNRVVQLAGDETFWLTLILDAHTPVLRDSVTLMAAFWQDDAPESLLAQLRQAGLCDALQTHWLQLASNHCWLALRFSAQRMTPAMAQQIESLFWQHWAALCATSPLQRQHYQRLAQLDFHALSPLAQLRAHAFGFAPGQTLPDSEPLLTALRQAPCSRLLTQRDVSQYADVDSQGVTLRLGEWPPAAAPALTPTVFSFYPRAAAPEPLTLPPHPRPLLRLPMRPSDRLLLLRPAFYQPLSEPTARARQRALRSALGLLRHAGGAGSWQFTQGAWQLRLDLPPEAELHSVQAVLAALNADAACSAPAPTSNLAIRQLLTAMPTALIAPVAQPAWIAAWCGEDDAEAQRLARLLSQLRAPLTDRASVPAVQRGLTRIACDTADHALLIFMPLLNADDRRLAALQALALTLGPRFFQRLRVDEPVGYVVSTRYQRFADIDGILLALQSPGTPWPQLLKHCSAFLREMSHALSDATPAMLAAWQATLREQCMPKDHADAVLQALRHQQGLANLTPQAIDALTLAQIQDVHETLRRARRRWRVLIAGQ
ncbi:pyrroloquinoline quinone biosynthesis protein PqqF [Pantoea sp.]|uniref:pyrroloquinoline quinone biosynthesis protein PqqF n=1 Tax=Pantoea sp. TaxID=69393 RepID=UPI0031E21123